MNGAEQHSILVACIGNIFLGDDGFGCAVACELASMEVPPQAEVIDYGIRGLDLAYALLGPYKTVILVDAISRGEEPGTVYLLQPLLADGASEPEVALDPHSMDPMHLMAMARSLGEITAEIYIVGCEPLDLGDEFEGRMSLSETVKAAVPEGARAVIDLIHRINQYGTQEQQQSALIYTAS